MLEYDNSAFYYFALTLLVIYILPGTWYALSEFVLALIGSGDVGTKARTKAEKEKAQELKKATTGWARLNTTWYKTNLIAVIIAWLLFAYLITLVINDGEVRAFDPYQILGIEQGAAVGEIKKAYRKLSLKYHPDKNIGDKMAEEMFMKIAKAYEALTDEASKENYEKYGNPDGKQSLEVSIGLPKILLENPKVVLVLYLIGMVVIIPSVVGWWYSNSKQFGENNVMYETYNGFYTLLQESHRVKNLPEILAASAEFRALNGPKPSDEKPMDALYEKMKKDKIMVKPRLEHPRILRGNLLLHAHMLRSTDSLTPELKKDLRSMLSRAPELIDGLIEIAQQRRWLNVTLSAIELNQSIVQGLAFNAEPFAQIPFLDEKTIKAIKASGTTFKDYLKLSDDEKKNGLKDLKAEDREEALKACKLITNMKVETKMFVEEEENDEDDTAPAATNANGIAGDKIFENDLVTIRVTFTRENVPEGKNAFPVHAPYFPTTILENWWVLLTDRPKSADPKKAQEPNIHAFEKISDQKRVVTHEIRFMAPPQAGTYEMDLKIFCDAYAGLDHHIPIKFDVHPADELPEYTPHPEDLELDNEPTLFEQVMAANMDEDSSSDEEEEEDEQPAKQPAVKNTAPAGKTEAAAAPKKNKHAVVEDVDSEDD